MRIAPRPFPSQVGRVLGRARTPCFVETSPSASRLLCVGMSLSTLLSFAAVAQRRTKVCSQPLIHSGWIRTPWAPSSCPRLSPPSDTLRRRRAFRKHWRADCWPAYAGIQRAAFILTEPNAKGWASVPCLLSLTPCHIGGGLGMPATPAPFGGTEPPGRLPPAPGSQDDGSGGSIFARSNPLSRSLPLTSRSWARMGLTAQPSLGFAPGEGILIARAASPRTVVCTLPLTTVASQSLPIAYLPASGPRGS